MKNFEWKNEDNKIDSNGSNFDVSNNGPDEPEDDELSKQIHLALIMQKIYTGTTLTQIFVCVYAAFAWLWQTQWAPFATFLFFLVLAFENIVTLVDMTLNLSVRVLDIENDEDDNDNDDQNMNNIGRRS